MREFVAKSFHPAQQAVDADLSEGYQTARNLPAKHRRDQADVERDAKVCRILALHQAHHLNVEIVSAHITINADFLGIGFQVIVGNYSGLICAI